MDGRIVDLQRLEVWMPRFEERSGISGLESLNLQGRGR